MTRLFLLNAALKLESPERRVRAASDVDINALGASNNLGSSEQMQPLHFSFLFFLHKTHTVCLQLQKLRYGLQRK